MKRFATLAGLLLAISAPVLAQVTPVPPLINFQGRLARPDGSPVADGTHSVAFALYNAATGGTLKWSETDTVTVRNGGFAVLLGNGTALNDAIFAGNVWLQISVDGATPLTPRQPLVSVAYAFKADTVPDGSITSVQLATGAVTGSKIAAGTITADKLASGIGGLTLPFSATLGSSSTLFSLTNTGTGYGGSFKSSGYDGLYAETTYSSGNGIVGVANTGGAAYGVEGVATQGYGGYFSGGVTGAFGDSTSGTGVYGNSSNGNGVYGTSGAATGVYGNSTSGYGVYGTSPNNVGVYGNSATGTGIYGGSTTGFGVHGYSPGTGVFGESTTGNGVSGYSNSLNGVVGSSATGTGVYGYSTSSYGVRGYSVSLYGVYGTSNSIDGIGVVGDCDNVRGRGVNGSANGTDGRGVNGVGTAYGIYGRSFNGIGVYGETFSNNYAGYFAGNLGYTGNLTHASDARYKTNIVPLPHALDSVLALRGVTYDYKREAFPTMNLARGKQYGLIAQEVETVLPALVHKDKKGYRSLDYTQLVPVLIEAVKTQQKQITLQTENAKAQRQEIAALKAQLREVDALKKEYAELRAEVKAQTAANVALSTHK